DDDDIKKYMKEFGHLPNCYALISEKMGNKINPKRIYQRWTNNLNPNLCHDSFNDNEKSFINEWVEEYKIRNPSSRSISLKEIIPVMKEKFGKLRSENKVKNFWHAQQRKKGRNTSQGPSGINHDISYSHDISYFPQYNNRDPKMEISHLIN
ncbi:12604_t:CDS:2, partial [Rhizophagus irregularis]